jgi:hypothetical protein
MHKAVSVQGRQGVPAGQEVGGAKHALLAEQIRIRHIHKALGCAANELFRERCEAELASSVARALQLERAIRAENDAAAHPRGDRDAMQLGECLLSAMDLARANGDASAAEAVAQECLALVEMHCRTLLDEPSHGPACNPRGQLDLPEGAVGT